MHEKYYDILGEKVYEETLDNGLRVHIIPKRGFKKYFASYTTKYGSIHTKVNIDGKEIVYPDGIAHFLEHKLFEGVQGDATLEFAKYGANVNAYTSFGVTSYHFNTTENFKECTKLLIDFVCEPYFTDESVMKEQGIIGQEIEMYNDNPDWQLYFRTLKNLYHDHPVKVDIAGTIESISKTTKEMLYECYNSFYHPSNMHLVLVGDFDVKEMSAFIKEVYKDKKFDKSINAKTEEFFDKEGVYKKSGHANMNVANSKVMVAIKDKKPNRQGAELIKHTYAAKILLTIVLGRSSENRNKLLAEKLIDDSFDIENVFDYTYGHILLAGDTDHPKELERRLKEIIKSVSTLDVSVNDFNRIKNKYIGKYLSALNSVEYIGSTFTRMIFNDISLFDAYDALVNIKLEDVISARNIFDETQVTSYIIEPNEK